MYDMTDFMTDNCHQFVVIHQVHQGRKYPNTPVSNPSHRLMLIPADPLTVAPFEEQIRTLEAAPWHGTIEYAPLEKRVFKNAEGSWTFYYEPDGKSHTFWDCYGDIHREESDGWMVTDSTWLATYHALLYYLQGRRVLVDVPDGKGNITSYRGRCWVSSYASDSDGRIKAVISYSLAPPE